MSDLGGAVRRRTGGKPPGTNQNDGDDGAGVAGRPHGALVRRRVEKKEAEGVVKEEEEEGDDEEKSKTKARKAKDKAVVKVQRLLLVTTAGIAAVLLLHYDQAIFAWINPPPSPASLPLDVVRLAALLDDPGREICGGLSLRGGQWLGKGQPGGVSDDGSGRHPPPDAFNDVSNQTDIARLAAADLTAETFYRDFVWQGRPLIITGLARRWPILDWNLAEFAEVLGDQKATARSWLDESGEIAHLPRGGTRVNRTLAEIVALRARGPDATGRLPDPYYNGWVANDFEDSLAAHDLYSNPPFLRNHRPWHPEWLYFGAPTTGTPPHRDEMCVAKYSVQIRGRKRWLLRPWPEMDHLTAHEFVLEEGEALFFWPDWEHSTVCLDGGHDSGCLSFHQYVETDLAHNCYLQQFLFGEPLAGRADGAAAKTAGHRRFARHQTVMRRKCHVKLGE